MMPNLAQWRWRSLSAGIGGLALDASAELKMNLPEPVSPLTAEIFDLHMLTTLVSTIIMVAVIGLVGFTIYRFRKSQGSEADQDFNDSRFGTWGWILVPIIVLGIDLSIAGPGAKTLKNVEAYEEADLTLKVIGSQWKWTYEYLDQDISFVSNLNNEDLSSPGYLREVDNPVVLPTHQRIRFLHTASDVLHNWWVPAVAPKKDSIPGYINETWTIIEQEGTYYGQCAELCGTRHAYMPIVVKAVSEQEFAQWVADKKQQKATQLAEATAEKEWSKAELMARGESVYNRTCAACHQIEGTGTPPVFPALKGSAIALGDVSAHIDIVLNGKAGTAMSAWGSQLNDLEIAAVVTYERNAWGNDSGDLVQPAAIKAAR
ncbi:cytochrome c oxidase subunit II [Aestuariirhabdus sp. Z084]|uniref:cytochrome c oxidase subunit II n=1 Tax=Aestuariirhabdus haliotis TaxID=2918751 RepID=UPI00201B407F|nr:cytochrome c oxidase subunit II [Aestuariirhabdus haliotis]MCL6414269.1 cytochrome c oxidase subunit II [Aestuariirhabdus haliotis]MCL6418201.1 cytochrome c oxidase subunit II [Aestuariirhabdus haliotis]